MAAALHLPGFMGFGHFGVGAEKRRLLELSAWDTAKKAHQPVHFFFGAFLTLCAFTVAYVAVCFEVRKKFGGGVAAAVALLPQFALAALMLYVARMRRRRHRPTRVWFACALGLALGALYGAHRGNVAWYDKMVKFYGYHDMGDYVNLDPAQDVGQAFMDAGTVYFKESSFVLTRKALAFHNGATYCVAPIVRELLELESPEKAAASGRLMTETNYALPRAGTVDYWAVGTNCCGTTGTDGDGFTCGDTHSMVARAGLRLLDAKERENYLLATQQWSASIGLPVRTPLFFHWVKDPVVSVREIRVEALHELYMYVVIVSVVSLFCHVCFHALLKWRKVL